MWVCRLVNHFDSHHQYRDFEVKIDCFTTIGLLVTSKIYYSFPLILFIVSEYSQQFQLIGHSQPTIFTILVITEIITFEFHQLIIFVELVPPPKLSDSITVPALVKKV